MAKIQKLGHKVHKLSKERVITGKYSFSKLQLAIFVIAFALVGGYVLLRLFAAGSTANVFVAPSGSDSGANCKRYATAQANPGGVVCASFNQAYQLAQAGDIVEVAAGTYSDQQVNADASKTSQTDVVFKPAASASVTTGSLNVYGSHMTFQDFTLFHGDWQTFQANDITFKNVTVNGGSIFTQSSSNISVIGGSVGNVIDTKSQIGIWPPDTPNTNILIDGVTFHDIRRSNETVHIECLLVGGVNGLIIRNSKFYNCDVFDLSIGSMNGVDTSNATIENNTFAAANGYFSFGINTNANTPMTNWNVRNNTSDQEMSFGTAPSYVNFKVSGNVAPISSWNCAGPGINYSHNVWFGPNAATCGASDMVVADPGFVNPAAFDYHLKSTSPAINAGDPTNCPATDIDGNTRPQGLACDAGADEFVATGANIWIDTNGGSCTRQASLVAYNDSAACSSMQLALVACQPGDTIIMKAGSYGAQNISAIKAAPGCTIIGETVTNIGDLTTNGAFYEIRNITSTSWALSGAGTHDITLRNVDFPGNGGIYLNASGYSNISWIGGSLRNFSCSTCAQAMAVYAGDVVDGTATASNFLIDGVTFDNVKNTGGNTNHFEVVRIDGNVNGFSIKNSTFTNTDASSSTLFFTTFRGTKPQNITLENNFFSAPGAAFFVINENFQGSSCSNWTIRYNTFLSTAAAGGNCSYSNVVWTGNLGPAGNCEGSSYVNNVWYGSGTTCGASDRVITSPGLGGSGGFYLQPSSGAIDAAGSGANCIATDHDGEARPAGAACDAGADEFNGIPAPSAPTVSLTAAPTSIAPGGSSTLTWSSTNATSCTASGAWSGAKAIAGGTQSVSPTATSTYTLACTGTGGTTTTNATVTVAAPPPPTSSTPVASYGFGEGSGTTTADSSGNNNTQTLSSATWNAAGKHGKAISFNGTSGYASAPDSSSLYIAGTGTMEAWVKLNTTGQWHGLIAKGNTNANEAQNYAMEITNSDTVICILGDGTNSLPFMTSTTALTAGTYYHVACTWDGTNVKVYVNGALERTMPQTITPADNASPLFLGQFGGSSDFMNGSLDDVMLYNKALTPAEITADMSVSVGGAPSDTTAPTISMTAPANGATVLGNTTVSVNASDNIGVSGVQFQLDCPGANCGLIGTEDTTSPYSYSWDTTGITNGTHTLSAIARDAAGNTATAASVTVTVNNPAPPPPDTTAPTTPAGLHNTTKTTTSITIAWNASTDTGGAGVRGYRIYKGGTFLTEVPGLSYPDNGLTPNTSYSYKVSAIDNAGNESAQSGALSVTTNSLPPTANLTASPATITSGGSSTLTWSSTNAIGCTASGAWAGNKPTSGTQSVSPSATSTYTLVCTGTGGTTPPVGTTVTVNAPPPVPTVTITASPATITSGSSSTLTWSSTSATSCSTGGAWSGNQALSGSLVVSPTATSTYTITCTGTGGSANSSAAVTVNAPAPPPTPGVTGDLNGDGHVNIFDLSILLSHYGSGGTGDIDSNGTVNIFDLSILLSNYGK